MEGPCLWWPHAPWASDFSHRPGSRAASSWCRVWVFIDEGKLTVGLIWSYRGKDFGVQSEPGTNSSSAAGTHLTVWLCFLNSNYEENNTCCTERLQKWNMRWLLIWSKHSVNGSVSPTFPFPWNKHSKEEVLMAEKGKPLSGSVEGWTAGSSTRGRGHSSASDTCKSCPTLHARAAADAVRFDCPTLNAWSRPQARG